MRILDTSDAHEVLAYSNVIIVIWRQPPRAELIQQLYILGERLTIEQGVPKVSVISVVDRHFRQAPSPAARAALTELHRDPKQILHRMGLVFVNEGFVLASIRSVLLSVKNKLMGTSNSDVFRKFEDAAHWVTQGLASVNRRSVSPAPLSAEVNRYMAQQKASSLAS